MIENFQDPSYRSEEDDEEEDGEESEYEAGEGMTTGWMSDRL
jgi:hypothetical protein